jgi:hypothetical protein
MSTQRVHVATDTVIALMDKNVDKVTAVDTVAYTAELTDIEVAQVLRAVNTFNNPSK